MQSPKAAVPFVPTQNHRFHLLDALRGVAALIVVLFHFPPNLRFGLAAPIAYLAVDFFFCLSGFVIAFSYEERLACGMSLKDFAVARLIRLYPLYFLGTLLGLFSTLAIARAGFDTAANVSTLILFGLFLIPNFFAHWMMPFPLNVVSWSLFYELVANLAFAMLVGLRWKKSAVFLLLALVSLAFLGYHILLGGGTTIDVGANRTDFLFGLARVGYSFWMGVLVCRLYLTARRPSLFNRLRWLLPIAVTASLVAVLLASSSFARSVTTQLLAVALFFPAIVLCGAWSSLPQSWNKVCAFFGDFSYPLYILHYPLLIAMSGRKFQHLAHARTHTAQALTVAWFVFLVAFAWSAGSFYDAPVRKWLTRAYSSHVRRLPRLVTVTGLSSVPVE